MTIVCALKYKNKVVVGADSLVVAEDRKHVNVKDMTKLIKFKNGWYCGYAGLSTIFCVLEEIRKSRHFNKKSYMKMEDMEDASAFLKDVLKKYRLKGKYRVSEEKVKEGDEIELMIITPTKIYTSTSCLDVLEYDTYAAIGCGEDIAKGAVEALLPTIKKESDLLPILKKVLNITVKLNSSCGKPFVIAELNDD